MTPLQNHLVVVTGLPRSGTSMLMQMLSSGGLPVVATNNREPDTDNPRGYFEHEGVKALARDAAWLTTSTGKAIKVVAPLVQFIPSEIPCRVLFIERDLDEVMASQEKMLRRSGGKGALLEKTRLREVFAKQVEQAKSLLANRPSADILFLNHRAIVQSPKDTARSINQFLLGSLDEDAMAQAVDASLYRNRTDEQN